MSENFEIELVMLDRPGVVMTVTIPPQGNAFADLMMIYLTALIQAPPPKEIAFGDIIRYNDEKILILPEGFRRLNPGEYQEYIDTLPERRTHLLFTLKPDADLSSKCNCTDAELQELLQVS